MSLALLAAPLVPAQNAAPPRRLAVAINQGCCEFSHQWQRYQQGRKSHQPRYRPRTEPEAPKTRYPAHAFKGTDQRHDACHQNGQQQRHYKTCVARRQFPQTKKSAGCRFDMVHELPYLAARVRRSRTPSQSSASGGASTQISFTPVASSSRSTENSSWAATAATVGMVRTSN